jgi:hypothetical protein
LDGPRGGAELNPWTPLANTGTKVPGPPSQTSLTSVLNCEVCSPLPCQPPLAKRRLRKMPAPTSQELRAALLRAVEQRAALVGPESKGLSAPVVAWLKGRWSQKYQAWRRKPLGRDRWVYVWANGIPGAAPIDRRVAIVRRF